MATVNAPQNKNGPTEDAIHIQVVKYLTWLTLKIRFKFMHIPNEGKRNSKYAAKLKAMGVSAGVPDLFIPYPNKFYHGLWIELKREKGGKVSDAQRDWINYLNSVDYKAVVCRGFSEAQKAIDDYMKEVKK